ncbi:MAG: Xaa-Pro peptidase family protein [Planctomycetaceae bacterium]|jgi:Xaa-Pro aminopeptidase|nr:Xaa-Pro peptidase family protein [Planctomycetaceae bacterium]
MNDKYFDRRRKIQKATRKLDAFLVTNPINVRYLTGFTGGAGCLLIAPDGDTLLSDPRFTLQIEEECPGLNAVIRPRNEHVSQTLRSLLGKTTSGKLGIEAGYVTLAQKDRLFEMLQHWEAVPLQKTVEEFRQIKDKEEIAAIRKAVHIAGEAFHFIVANYFKKEIKEGIDSSESDFCNFLEFIMSKEAEDKSFPSIIAAGVRSALPHATPGGTIIRKQSHCIVDWGCIVNGYMSDLTRVMILNLNDKKLRKVYETVLKANEKAIAAIKPGKTCEEIDAVARNIITDAGYGKHFGHGLGHSVGLQIHEDPRFAAGDKTVLKPGMVLTVEPGIYLKGWGGVRIEDDILVTKTGCEVLSKNVPKKFEEAVVTL